jgi:serine/threonine protein kinase
MIAANVSTQEPWAGEPTVALMLDGFNHRLTISEARRRLFGEGPIVKIGRYRIEARIGAGGMGEVYLAVDEELDRKVAIKRVLPGLISERQHQRLRDEARALAKLSHSNVVQVYEIGEHDHRTFLAMEYVEGQTLAGWLAAEPRAWREILNRFCAAGRGLAAAHEAGVIHRDFKPENILLGDDGSVRVADFGIALAEANADAVAAIRTIAEHDETGATHYIAGTFRYMSFEQLRGDSLDARSDQFAFCVALYEALWGTQPWPLGNALERLDVLAREHPHKPARGRVPMRVWRILRRGLARSPKDRWPDMSALLDALEAVPCQRRSTIESSVWALTGLGVSAMLASAILSSDDDAPPAAAAPVVSVAEPAEPAEPSVELAQGPGRERPGTGPRIWITGSELHYADAAGQASRRLTSVEDGRIPATKNHLVEPLHELFDGAARPGAHDSLTLFVDRSVQWSTIVDVLYTTGRAGWRRWDFVVETAGETRVLTAKPPQYSVPEVQLAQLAMLQLWVTPERVEVSTQIARPMDAQPGTVRALDVGDGDCGLDRGELESLRSLSSRLCELSGVAIPVWVAAEPTVSWADVVEVLGHAMTEGVCHGGIVVSTDTRAADCDAPTRPDDLRVQAGSE